MEGLEIMAQAQVHKKGRTTGMFPSHSVSYPDTEVGPSLSLWSEGLG